MRILKSANLMIFGMIVLFAAGVLVSPTYAKIDPESIVGMWPFDEGGAETVKDSSGNGNDGEMIGGVERTDDSKFGKAVWFDGKNAHIDIKDSEDLHTETFTLVSWFKLEVATGSWQTIFGKQSGGSGLIIEVAAGGVLNTGFGTDWLCTGETPINDEEWHHVASVYDGESVKLYIDGSLDQETTGGTRPPENTMPLRIGGSPDIGEMFCGPIDEVAFLNVALTEEEIQNLMEGFAKFLALEPERKLAFTWGSIKAQY